MYMDDYGRRWDGPHPFTKASVATNAPSVAGVYQVLYGAGAAEQVAYIGIATGDTIRGRLTKHVTGKGNRLLSRLGDPAKFTVVFWVCDLESARQVESHVITTRKPPFNTRPEFRDFIPSIAVH